MVKGLAWYLYTIGAEGHTHPLEFKSKNIGKQILNLKVTTYFDDKYGTM